MELLYFKLFTAVIVALSQKASVFVNAIHFYPILIFADKGKSLSEWSPILSNFL